jgi:molybdopterin synthase catalytic subunit
MSHFALTTQPIHSHELVQKVLSSAVGAVVTFEGRVRDHNFGREVVALEYEVYEELACSEGNRVLAEAIERFGLLRAVAVHRYGHLGLQDVAVSVVAVASHRDEAFSACRFIIDEIKLRLPIWKREHYAAGTHAWVDCPGCQRAMAKKNASSKAVFSHVQE